MKRSTLNLVIACVLVFTLISCENTGVDTPKLSVSLAEGLVIEQVGDTLVCKKNDALRFIIDGNPDMLVFFSGHAGSEFRYRNRTEIDGDPAFSFNTLLTFGTQFNGLKVYVSSTFPGITREEVTDRTNISNMEYWQEITDQCNLPTTKNAPNNEKASPLIDLSDFKGKPFYLAFRLFHPQGNESTWRMSNLRIINTFNGIDTEIGSFKTIGFTAFDMVAASDPYLSDGNATDKTNRRWNLNTASSDYITVGGSTGNTVDNNDWAVSDKINLTKAIPDKGVAIKGFDNAPLEEYEYQYDVPGVYTVTFLGVNSLYDSRAEAIQELIIKIID